MQPTISEHRVTASNPPLTSHFDSERCAALHNLIIERGWKDSRHAPNDLRPKTWWDEYGHTLDSAAEKFHPSVMEFLKSAWSSWNAQGAQFFFSIHGIPGPEYMWEECLNMENDDDDDEDEEGTGEFNCAANRYITLYARSDTGGHPLGIVFDQKKFKAVMMMSLWDTDIAMNGRIEWLPLELILNGWISMIDRGKIGAMPKDLIEKASDQQPVQGQWYVNFFAPADREDTLDAWHGLLDAIEARMGLAPATEEERRHTLLSDKAFAELLMLSLFRAEFLNKARVPRFRFLAPGLRVLSPATLIERITTPLPGFEGHEAPLLLCNVPSHPTLYLPQNIPGNDPSDSEFLFGGSKDTVFAPGLYFSCTEWLADNVFGDSFRLVLPYRIGSAGYARKSDGLLMGELARDKEEAVPRVRHAELYQLGYNSIFNDHDAQLFRLLENWKERVERGDWKVGAEGVEGGIEMFKDADTEEFWPLYQLPSPW